LKYFAFLLSLVVLPLQGQARDLEKAFHELRDSGEDYEITGAVCEQVARLDFQDIFPAPTYTVTTGIAYGTSQRTIGELDVIVFRNKDRKAVVIAEVKCWRNLASARQKATEQRTRFLSSMQGNFERLYFEHTGTGEQVAADSFAGPMQFISIAQSGGKAAGFEREINNSLDELLALRERLIKCQKAGACRRSSR
jgi:hypothetical protein